jgi:hypothetical protein
MRKLVLWNDDLEIECSVQAARSVSLDHANPPQLLTMHIRNHVANKLQFVPVYNGAHASEPCMRAVVRIICNRKRLSRAGTSRM